ncbi:MAG: flagellar basal body rod protein FlgC [Xanthomonadaceae bacterium]|nr:flagellar basal body rod protein FlgC [Xanthomonadaceae bacterium]
MSGFGIFDIAGSALAAQSVRLNTVASNLANAESVSGDPEQVFRPREPVFEAVPVGEGATLPGVRVKEVAENTAAPLKRYEPGHPLADGEGYVYAPPVDAVEQMVNMISAARSYQANVEVMTTARDLTLRTIGAMGR